MSVPVFEILIWRHDAVHQLFVKPAVHDEIRDSLSVLGLGALVLVHFLDANKGTWREISAFSVRSLKQEGIQCVRIGSKLDGFSNQEVLNRDALQ